MKLKYRSTTPKPDDPDILKRVAEAVRKGYPVAATAQHAGIGERTLWEWLQLGEDEAATWDGVTELGSHALLARTFKAAQADFVRENLGVVHRDKACEGKGWLPAMTLLERRMPQDFGRHDRVTQDVRQVSVSVTIDSLPSSEQRALAEALLRALDRREQRALPEPASE